jgi:hypothetical protein
MWLISRGLELALALTSHGRCHSVAIQPVIGSRSYRAETWESDGRYDALATGRGAAWLAR